MKKYILILAAIFMLLPSCGEKDEIISEEISCEYSSEASSVETSGEEYKLITTITVNNKEIEIYDSFYNKKAVENGVYLYDKNFTGTRDAIGTDVVIVNKKVCYIGENEIAMIPNAGGIVLTFYNTEVGDIKIGDSINTKFNTKGINGKFVEINDSYFPIDLFNGIRSPEGVSVYYDSSYGETTGTNSYGIDIEISGGKVININRSGNSVIPTDGYVLSIHCDSVYYGRANQSIHIGDEASELKISAYNIEELDITAIGGTRTENSLILYQSGRTGTNSYGYEIMISDGIMVSASTAGNASVPKNGYVLSGHGTSAEILKNSYSYGTNVYLNESKTKVLLVKNPYTALYDVENIISQLKSLFENAENNLSDIDYDTISNFIDDIDNAYKKSVLINFQNGKYEDALNEINIIKEKAKSYSYLTYEQSPVANKAVWYRSYAKSDEDAEKEIKDMVALGFNTIYLEAYYNGRFIGFANNELITHHTAENGEYDLLEGYVTIAHKYGVEVHAWVHDFFIGTVEKQEETDHELADYFRNSWLKDKSGRENFYYSVSDTNFIFIDPSNEEYTELLSELYMQIISEYEVDGIQLDYIRFPERNGTDDFGYNDNIISAWQQKENTSSDPRKLAEGSALQKSWVKFRQDVISSFVRRIYTESKAINSDVIISAAVYPNTDDAKNNIFQDCEAWINEGIIDCVFSMSYGNDYDYVSNNIQSFDKLTSGKCLYIPGISAFSKTEDDILAKQINASYEIAGGVAVFSMNYIGNEGYNGVISRMCGCKSVQTYKYGLTVGTYTKWILSKINGVYKKYGGLTVNSEITSLLENIISLSSDFGNGKGKTKDEKREYSEKIIHILENDLKNSVQRLDESKAKSFLISDISDITEILKTQLKMINR